MLQVVKGLGHGRCVPAGFIHLLRVLRVGAGYEKRRFSSGVLGPVELTTLL